MANGAGYALTGDEGDLWGEVEEIIGLFTGPADRPRQVELIGCAPQGALRTAIASIGTDRALAGNADLTFLDSSGDTIGSYFVNDLTVQSVRPGGAPGLVDLIVRLSCGLALPGSELPWQLVRTGQLDRPGLWHDLDRTGRHAWLSVALTRQVSGSAIDQPAGAAYRLDGRCVTEEDGFYCAIGEAVNGPGGYFGWNLDALVDCLRGGFGAETPFTLDWRSFETARALPRLDTILEILADGEVTVVPRPPAG
jgi:RNAse (barnase) inhibitor barstar